MPSSMLRAIAQRVPRSARLTLDQPCVSFWQPRFCRSPDGRLAPRTMPSSEVACGQALSPVSGQPGRSTGLTPAALPYYAPEFGNLLAPGNRGTVMGKGRGHAIPVAGETTVRVAVVERQIMLPA
jgi:hypothetical protein